VCFECFLPLAMATQTYLLVFSKPVHVLDWKDGALLVKLSGTSVC